ncbi:MAG TPA: Rieske 2Fe-2S domain-containing protein [Polyangiaceae bacterium]|jgi:nitrite reductase/ring-hydroxylating ferredoxin subunit
MSGRVVLQEAEAQAVRAGRWVHVNLGRYVDVGGLRTKSALVGKTQGVVRAWANACLHQPLPLDVTSDPEWITDEVRAAPMDERRLHLLCHSHGALYRTRDGYCISGPCMGQALLPMVVEMQGETIAVVLPPA